MASREVGVVNNTAITTPTPEAVVNVAGCQELFGPVRVVNHTNTSTPDAVVNMAACPRAVQAQLNDPLQDYYDTEGQKPAPKRVEVAREPLPATGRPRPTTLKIFGHPHTHDIEGRLRAEAIAAERARAMAMAAFFASVRAFFGRLWALFYRRGRNDEGDDETLCCSCFVVTRRVTAPQPVPSGDVDVAESGLRRELDDVFETAV